jgi:hypothetical protein
MNISPVKAELFHEDGQNGRTDRYEEAKSHFSQFVKEPKNLSQRVAKYLFQNILPQASIFISPKMCHSKYTE